MCKISWDDNDQTSAFTILARRIATTEDGLSNNRTILVGDFNANPFDPGVVSAFGLHAMMTKKIALKRVRTVQGESCPYFYNPMWGLFGDGTPGPAGTYYLHSSKPINHFWNMYDQVLLRPELVGALQELRILDTDGNQSLLTAVGVPDKDGASDHLPVLFRLDI
jgi:hypothetical protein